MWWSKKKQEPVVEKKPEPITFDPRDDVYKRALNLARFMGFYNPESLVNSLGRGLMHYQDVDKRYVEYLKQQKRNERAQQRKENVKTVR